MNIVHFCNYLSLSLIRQTLDKWINSEIKLNLFVWLYSHVNSSRPPAGTHATLCAKLIWTPITQPQLSLTLSTPPKSHWWTISSQWSYSCCVLVFMPVCSSLKPPPRSRLSDRTIAAVQVSTPVTWGFTFANHRLPSQLSMFTSPYCGRISDAAALQMLATVQPLVRWAAKLHRHPYCATGSIIHCLQWRWSGSSVSKRLYSGDSVPDYWDSSRY